MQRVFFHWGISPVGHFAVAGLALATSRSPRPSFLVSSAFVPLRGDKVKGPFGKAIDIRRVATIFGVATSLASAPS